MTYSFPRGLSPFYIRIFQTVDDPSSDSIISWSKTKDSFVVWNLRELSRKILPKSVEFGVNLTQFVSKLRKHGFERIKGGEQFEYGHEDFVRGQPQLLKKMMIKALTAKRNAKKAKARAKRARNQVEFLLQRLHI